MFAFLPGGTFLYHFMAFCLNVNPKCETIEEKRSKFTTITATHDKIHL